MDSALAWVLLAVAVLAAGVMLSTYVEATTRDEDDVRRRDPSESHDRRPDLSSYWDR